MELTAYIREGNAFVFEQVYFKYRAKVYTYLLSKSKSEAVAEELKTWPQWTEKIAEPEKPLRTVSCAEENQQG